MRILQLHCSDFCYKIRKDTPVAERPPHRIEEHVEDVLVCFISFEAKDESRISSLLAEYVENLKIDISRIGCKRVLLYPYAHLSKSLGSAELAREFIYVLKEKLSDEGTEVHMAPFGWYKSFKLSCRGHPLSEAYREF